MKDLVKIRQRVYENFPMENLNATTSPIVITYDINSDDYNRLVKATQNFLCKSLSLVYKKEFVFIENRILNKVKTKYVMYLIKKCFITPLINKKTKMYLLNL